MQCQQIPKKNQARNSKAIFFCLGIIIMQPLNIGRHGVAGFFIFNSVPKSCVFKNKLFCLFYGGSNAAKKLEQNKRHYLTCGTI